MRRRLRNRVSRLLHERGMSDHALAVRTGIDRSRINRVKNRRARTTVADALRIAEAMSLRVAEVFWLDDALPVRLAAPTAGVSPEAGPRRVSI